MRMELVIRFDYGTVVPWVRRTNESLLATGGPDTLELHTSVELARAFAPRNSVKYIGFPHLLK